jgi:phage terminase large subunit-like protein
MVAATKKPGDEPGFSLSACATTCHLTNPAPIEGCRTWNKAFKEEYRQFPRGKFKDQVDSGRDSFNELALGGQSYSGAFRH